MRRRLRTVLVLLGAAVVLGAVFAAYRQPDLVVDLGNRLWSCF